MARDDEVRDSWDIASGAGERLAPGDLQAYELQVELDDAHAGLARQRRLARMLGVPEARNPALGRAESPAGCDGAGAEPGG